MLYNKVNKFARKYCMMAMEILSSFIKECLNPLWL
jgi:hypothetical protein